MSYMKRRFGRDIVGRGLACFAAAFSVMLFCLCFNVRDAARGVLWAAAAAALFCAVFVYFMGALKGAALTLLAASAAGLVFFFGVYGSYCRAERLDGQDAAMTVEALSYPTLGDYYTLFDAFEIKSGEKLTVLIYKPYVDILPGDRVTVYGGLTVQEDEYFISSAAEKQFLTMRADGDDYSVDRPEHMKLRYLPLRVSHRLTDIITTHFEGDRGSLLSALITGSREGMSRRFRNDLALSGASHIIAVSGLHMGIIAAVVVAVLGKRYGMAMSLPVMLAFGMLTGMNPPVVRAMLMSAVATGAFVFNRQPDSITTVMAALTAILIIEPAAVLSVSLQLSFAAVLGILLLYKPIERTMNAYLPLKLVENKWVQYIIRSFAVSLAATLMSLPVSTAYFGRISVISPLTNLAVLWMVPVIMELGLIFIACRFLLPVGLMAVKWVTGAALGFFISVIRVFAAPDFSSIASDDRPGLAMIIAFGLFIIFGYLVRPKLRRPLLIALAVFMIASGAYSFFGSRGRVNVKVYDSGLTMARFNGTTAAFVPVNEQMYYSLLDYLDCLYDWGEERADLVVFSEPCGEKGDFSAKEAYDGVIGYGTVSRTLEIGGIKVEMFEAGGTGACLSAGSSKLLWLSGASKADTLSAVMKGREKPDLAVVSEKVLRREDSIERFFSLTLPDTLVVCGDENHTAAPLEKYFDGRVKYLGYNASCDYIFDGR